MLKISVLLIVFLTACAPQSGTLISRDTGLQGSFTRQVTISNHLHHVLRGHVISTTRDGVQVSALVITARNDGVHRLVMREAWSNGVELPVRATNRRLDGCTHGHCRDRSVGMIFLSEALFSHAAIHGVHARLTGTGDAIDITAPPSLFQALPEYRDPA